jgi:hypothetical protein
MIELTGDERFVYDAYRRLIQMFGSVVMGIPDDGFRRGHGPPAKATSKVTPT